MAPPNGEAVIATTFNKTNSFSKPPRLSNDNNLHRTISDISYELSKEEIDIKQLPPISEVEDAKCECCGMSEECTPEYIDRVRNKFSGKWICGLCAEAVKEEKEKKGCKVEEALNSHMSACARFNKFGRAYPVLFQAEAMREMLKKSTRRAQSFNTKGAQKNSGIARSSSCIAAITRDMTNFRMPN
ncbi:uncharacterized protein LOC110613226 [Manihot esculenta]|uniref:DUF1677 family protein n=2 Tax=Manihot esculenta TaxID=3983 RepID=A0A2C9W4C9_MANES|nr:uncharacterized protein LOC110613226 [Manihot esculenta]KAG8656419.1 hypothetical protein MANES_04G133000v8 [Manihot esculenta]OAY53065.1 hypothetical protein MANES_04G133000v8 [Manihot esculenta]